MSRRLATLALVLCVSGCANVELDPAERSDEAGELSLEWRVVQGDVAVSCVDAGAREIEVVAYAGEDEVRQKLSCYGGFGVVGPIPAGLASVQVHLLSPAGDVIVGADIGTIEVSALGTTPLGAVELVVDP